MKTKTSKDFLSLFNVKKPIMAMIHLKGDSEEEIFERAKKEIDIYLQSDVDAIIFENYYGTIVDLRKALDYYTKLDKKKVFGINCLNVDYMGFKLGIEYNADFIQLDSVVGHVKERDEPSIDEFLSLMRNEFKGCLLGGVRFKYQPMLSIHSVEHDLEIAKTRCDGVVVTQDATGQATSMDKINTFRNALKDFTLIVGAGLTIENVSEQFEVVDGAIVGSYFKDTYKDSGDVSLEHIIDLMEKVKEIRRRLND